MKIKTFYFLFLFTYSFYLNALKIQPLGTHQKPKIYSLNQLKNLAHIDKNKVLKITKNPFPIKCTHDVLTFSHLCPHWSTWNVFSDEEFYEGNNNWLQYTSFIKKINFKMPIIIWQPLESSQKPYLTLDIPIFEGLQFDDRASIDIPNDIKVHTPQLAFSNEKNLYYFLKQGHTCKSLQLLASDWTHSLINSENHLILPQNLPERMKKLTIPLLELGTGCFQNHTTLNKVTLHDIKRLQDNVFSNCIELTEVEADDLEVIGANCFCNCPKLKKVHFKNLRTVGDPCFINYYSLHKTNDPLEITIGNLEGFKNLTNMLQENADDLQTTVIIHLEK